MKKIFALLLCFIPFLAACGGGEPEVPLAQQLENKTYYRLDGDVVYLASGGDAYIQGKLFTSTSSKTRWYIRGRDLCVSGTCYERIRLASNGEARFIGTGLYKGERTAKYRVGDVEGLSTVNNAEVYCEGAQTAATAWAVGVGLLNAALGGAEQGGRGYDAARRQSVPRAVDAACK